MVSVSAGRPAARATPATWSISAAPMPAAGVGRVDAHLLDVQAAVDLRRHEVGDGPVAVRRPPRPGPPPGDASSSAGVPGSSAAISGMPWPANALPGRRLDLHEPGELVRGRRPDHVSSSHRAASTCSGGPPPTAHATVCPIVQPRARSRSSPSSDGEPVEPPQHLPGGSGRARTSARSARPRTRARRRAASGRSRATARARRRARCRRADPGAAAPARPGSGRAPPAPRRRRRPAGARTAARPPPTRPPDSRPTRPPRRRACGTAARPRPRAAAAGR